MQVVASSKRRYFRIFITLSAKITPKVAWVAVTGEKVADRQTDREIT